MERWSGKVAVVTGASSGIGAAVVKDLVRAGLIVVGLARRDERIREIRNSFPENLQSKLHAIKCDVSKEVDVKNAFSWVEKNLGGTDILVNNAGIVRLGVSLISPDNTQPIREVLDTNVMAVVYCVREAFNSMKRRNFDGHIVVVNSVAGHQVINTNLMGGQSNNIYAPSKFAVTAMIETYRQEFANAGTKVKISSISPGLVYTEIVPEEAFKQFAMPVLQPENISEAILYMIGTPPNVQENDLRSYADDHNSSEGLILLSNPNVHHSTGERHPSLTIMNSSSTSANANHHQHHHSNNSGTSHNNNNHHNHNSSASPGILRHHETMTSSGVGAATSTGATHSTRQGIGGATGADTSGITGFHLGVYGWRKKCLYVLILGLMVLIIVNLVLTLWILKVMEFSSEGMGQLKIVAGGIQLSGQALILDLLRASTIRSRHGQPISIESSRNFSINTRDSSGFVENHLFLGHDRLECLATAFRINDSHGGNLFSVNRNEVTIGAHTLKIDGEGGTVFRDSIQTTHVRADAGRELRLESPTRQLEITASQDINLQSRAGSLEVNALKEIKISSTAGSIRLDSSHIVLPNLKTVQPPSPGSSPTRDHNHRVYQLCACFNGKLFLASAHSICAGDDSTVCR